MKEFYSKLLQIIKQTSNTSLHHIVPPAPKAVNPKGHPGKSWHARVGELVNNENAAKEGLLQAQHLENHTWHPDGLLSVNPRGSHPIYQLVHRASLHWKDKHERASTTLRQAVREYSRRYNRPPPKGFDHW